MLTNLNLVYFSPAADDKWAINTFNAPIVPQWFLSKVYKMALSFSLCLWLSRLLDSHGLMAMFFFSSLWTLALWLRHCWYFLCNTNLSDSSWVHLTAILSCSDVLHWWVKMLQFGRHNEIQWLATQDNLTTKQHWTLYTAWQSLAIEMACSVS